MNRKQRIIVSVTGIFIVLLILVGLTYAYFLTQISGNTNNKSISVTTADLKLVYGDGNGIITAEKIIPGTTLETKTFTVTNEGNMDIEYGVFIEDLKYDFEFPTIIYDLSCTSNNNVECNSISSKSFPDTNDLLVSNIIKPKETQSYNLTVIYEDNGIDQSNDMNKEFSGKIQIYDLKNTVDVKGKVTNYSKGDYIKISSNDPKLSKINKNGEYKIVGIKPDNHEISLIKNGNIEERIEEFIIEKSETEKIVDKTIYITDETRLAIININLNENDSNIEIDGTAKYDDGIYFAPISNEIIYANYNLTTSATQYTLDDYITYLENGSNIKLLNSKQNNSIAWFTDSSQTKLKIKYDGTKELKARINNNNFKNYVDKETTGDSLDVEMYINGEVVNKTVPYENEITWNNKYVFELAIKNIGELDLKYKTSLKLDSIDSEIYRKYLNIKVFDSNERMIFEGQEVNFESILLNKEFDVYKIEISLKI